MSLSTVLPPEPRCAHRTAFTSAARHVLAAVSQSDGPQAIVLAWPAGAAYLPRAEYAPHAFDVIIGHVEGCPIYVDTRRLAVFRDQQVVLDAVPDSEASHPALVARPGSGLERGHEDADPALDTPPPDPLPVVALELVTQFGETFPPAQIWTYVQDAINDLRGSVSAEALPEMASRLALHRLGCELSGGGPLGDP